MSPLVGKHSYEMAMKLDCLGKSAEDALECLRTKKAEELVPIPEVRHTKKQKIIFIMKNEHQPQLGRRIGGIGPGSRACFLATLRRTEMKRAVLELLI